VEKNRKFRLLFFFISLKIISKSSFHNCVNILQIQLKWTVEWMNIDITSGCQRKWCRNPVNLTFLGWLVIYCFTFRSRIFHLYGDFTIAGEVLQGSLSCHTYCDTGPRFIRSYQKDCPIQSPLTTRMGMRRTYSTWILTGQFNFLSWFFKTYTTILMFPLMSKNIDHSGSESMNFRFFPNYFVLFVS
jgi:hypothetical protein